MDGTAAGCPLLEGRMASTLKIKVNGLAVAVMAKGGK
jgi:hypothetical protein